MPVLKTRFILEWFCVKDRLPKEADYYLTACASGVHIWHFNNDGDKGIYWNFEHTEKDWQRSREPVTHWTYIPKSPIEE